MNSRRFTLIFSPKQGTKGAHSAPASRGPHDAVCASWGGSYEQTYQEEVDRCAAVRQRVSSGRRSTGYFATKDYSYRATRVAGDGWVMIGDAWGFLDPLYSSGVLLALRSGEMAADAIVEGLANGDTSGTQLPSLDQITKATDLITKGWATAVGVTVQ